MTTNALLTAATVAFASAASAESVILEGECRKRDTGGCTANNHPTYQAPDGKYIEPDSIAAGSVVSFNGIQPRCYEPELEGRVPYTIPGTSAVATFFTSFSAHVQVQSGSGIRDMNQVFKIKCEYNFNLGDLPG